MCTECGDNGEHLTIETDPRFDRLLAAWDGSPEALVTANGWRVWTPYALEAEMVIFLQLLTQRLVEERSDLVIVETGVGQGYTTRALVPYMRPEHDLYWCYESYDEWRMQLSIRDFWVRNLSACIKEDPLPEPDAHAIADLTIIHSDLPFCYAEYYTWEAFHKDDAILIYTGPKITAPASEGWSFGNPQGSVLFGDMILADEVWSAMVEQRRVPV